MTDISESGIEACPGCGRSDKLGVDGHDFGDIGSGHYAVKCQHCGWRGPETYRIEDARSHWNRRHPPGEEGLREDLELRDDLLIKAEKFRFGPDLTVESRGPSQWAVCHPGEVLNADGEWEWEPQPSSRTDEFIARTRFTFAEAVKRARALQSKKPE
jgi:hypothetical protein